MEKGKANYSCPVHVLSSLWSSKKWNYGKTQVLCDDETWKWKKWERIKDDNENIEGGKICCNPTSSLGWDNVFACKMKLITYESHK